MHFRQLYIQTEALSFAISGAGGSRAENACVRQAPRRALMEEGELVKDSKATPTSLKQCQRAFKVWVTPQILIAN